MRTATPRDGASCRGSGSLARPLNSSTVNSEGKSWDLVKVRDTRSAQRAKFRVACWEMKLFCRTRCRDSGVQQVFAES